MAHVLGVGAFGQVVKQGQVACKLCNVREIRKDIGGWTGVAREVHCGGFQHRHICTRYAVECQDFQLRIRMELGTPFDVMRAHPQKLLCDIGSALQFLHAHGILHRDVKPDNIILVGGVHKLIDFGLARPHAKGTDCLSDYAITRYWRPPELLTGSETYDGKCDVWSLGVVYYHTVYKKKPFTGNAAQMMRAIRRFHPTGILQHLLVSADRRFTSDELMVHLGRTPFARRVRLLPEGYHKCKVPHVPVPVRRVMDQYRFKSTKQMTVVAILASLVCGFEEDAALLVENMLLQYNMTQAQVFAKLATCEKM